jgi:hypothetical protein
MCHAFVSDARFYQFLFRIDQEIAHEVQLECCAHCGGTLHIACYPRKPRGIHCALDESCETRLSFCCATDGCRRRCTPPSVRFLGRKVYLGVMVILVTAMEHGLSAKRRKQLIEQLDLYPQTLARWRRWWHIHPGPAGVAMMSSPSIDIPRAQHEFKLTSSDGCLVTTSGTNQSPPSLMPRIRNRATCWADKTTRPA